MRKKLSWRQLLIMGVALFPLAWAINTLVSLIKGELINAGIPSSYPVMILVLLTKTDSGLIQVVAITVANCLIFLLLMWIVRKRTLAVALLVYIALLIGNIIEYRVDL